MHFTCRLLIDSPKTCNTKEEKNIYVEEAYARCTQTWWFLWYVEERDCCKIFGNKYICHHIGTHETAFKIFIAARQSFHKSKVAIVERIITQTHLLIYNCMFGISFGGG